MEIDMSNNQFGVAQDDVDGSWFYYSRGTSSAWDSFATRAEAEQAAQEFADRLREGEETERIVRNRLRMLIQSWASERVGDTGLPREEVLLDIRLGAQAALDDLCPRG
jgi:hypothetical protein